MSFRDAVEIIAKEQANKILGENNHPALNLEGLGDNLVGLFFGLVRRKREEELSADIQQILDNGNEEEIKNLFILVFQTRWCRGGKGEKHLFYIMFCKLYQKYPEICLDLLEVVPFYGSWKDLRQLHYYYFMKNILNQDSNLCTNLFIKMENILEKKLRQDIEELEKFKAGTSFKDVNISLIAKYYSPKKCFTRKEKVRTKKSKIDNMFFQRLALRIYGPQNGAEPDQSSTNYAEMMLRKKLVELRKALDIPEVKMCTKRWDEINFSRIASICLSKNNRVFLGEDRIGNIKYQDDPIRMKCRKNLLDQISSGLNGKQLAPNEMVEKVYHECVSAGIAAVMNSQWESLVKNVRDQIEKRVQENGSTNFDISRCVVMSDVSGSMAGTPMMVSVGFGILVSELTHPAFRDIVLTFDEDPVFYSLRACINFTGKVKALMRAPWGGSTNFEGAMNLIASVIEQNKLSEDEIPKSLLVVSDMQFNDAIGNSNYTKYHLRKWGTAFDNIKNMFANLGQRLYQKPIDPPQIIFWNVRANAPGFPAAANESGVTLMSGYSPALLKFIFSGDLEQEVEIADENGEVKKVKVKQTPKETLAKILGEKALDPVREIVNKYF